MAMLLVLETLNSTERAVFVLSEVFGYTHVEIADMIGKTDTNRAVIGRFLVAAKTGDVESLMDVLAPDVVHISDGGGQVTAARRPIAGAVPVSSYLIGITRKTMGDMDIELATYNALPAVCFRSDGRLDSILMIEVKDARVSGLYAVRNPDKLRSATTVHSLTRRKDISWRP
jgi:hypothetical protein